MGELLSKLNVFSLPPPECSAAVLKTDHNRFTRFRPKTKFGRPDRSGRPTAASSGSQFFTTDEKCLRVSQSCCCDRLLFVHVLPLCGEIKLSSHAVVVGCCRKLYWTECGVSPALRSVSLDGSGVSELVSGGLRCPSSLRLDSPRRVLYWVDPELGVMSSLTLDTGHRRVCTCSDSIDYYRPSLLS